MKRLLLLVLLSQTTLPIRVTIAPNHRMPAPINHHIDTLKGYIPNAYLRYGIAGTAFGLAATDNPIRRFVMNGMNKVQFTFNKVNQVTRDAHVLERNIRQWVDSFKRLS